MQISGNLTDEVKHLASNFLVVSQLEDMYRLQFKTERFTSGGMQSILTGLVREVEDKFARAEQAVQEVQSKLLTYFTSPPKPRLGPPRLVPKCCKAFGPGKLTYHEKIRKPVDSKHVCYSRDRASSGQGFDLWAEDALDVMKTNFETIPSILWQEIGTSKGLHVQFPTRARSCDGSGNSDAQILRDGYRQKLIRHPLNLVIVLDASDEMLNKVIGPGPPITHWDIVKKATIDVLGTLMLKDKVTIVTTGDTISLPSVCNTSILMNSQSSLATLKIFVQSVSPKGSPQYPEVIQQAFDLLFHEQENAKKSDQGAHNITNVILLLTNADTPLVLRERDLFQAVVSGQAKLDNKAHIQVYTVRQLNTQSAFTIFLRLADQNNEILTANDGTKTVTAGSWAPEGFTQPVGPVGFMASVSDSEGFGFSNDVVMFEKQLNIRRQTVAPLELIQNPALLKGSEGPTIQLFAPLAVNANTSYGIYAVTLSTENLLNGVTGFQYQFSSYAFVVERGTSHVLSHPKLDFQPEIKKTPRSRPIPTLDVIEPSLTAEQRRKIMSSDDVARYFDAKIPVGREVYRTPDTSAGLSQDALVGHLRVARTDFIVVLVIYKSEMERRVLFHPVLSFSNAIYHRFDKLPTNEPTCVTSGTLAMEQVFGVKFLPTRFSDSAKYKYGDLEPPDLLELNNFVKNPSLLTSDIKSNGKLSSLLNAGINESLELSLDLVAFTSSWLKDIWENTETTAINRFIGTTHGVLTILPAIAFPNTMDYRKYHWYTEAVMATPEVIVSIETFPGTTKNLIISQSFGGDLGVVAVTGASVSPVVLKSLLSNQVRECAAAQYSCELMDKKGYILDVWNKQIRKIHITERYPWLANQLLENNVMKTVWCSDFTSGQNRAGYTVTTSQKGIDSDSLTSTTIDDCRKFVMYRIDKTNVFVLVLASRLLSNCPPENNTPKERCGATLPPVPSFVSPTCDICTLTTNSSTQQCHRPCYCQMEINMCSGAYKKPDASPTLSFCQDKTLDPPTDANKPDAPGPTVSRCPAKCSEMTTEQDCLQQIDCEWDATQSFPTCKHKIRTTTAASTTTARSIDMSKTTANTGTMASQTTFSKFPLTKTSFQFTSTEYNGISTISVSDDDKSTTFPDFGMTSSKSGYSTAIIVGVSVPISLLLFTAVFLMKKRFCPDWIPGK